MLGMCVKSVRYWYHPPPHPLIWSLLHGRTAQRVNWEWYSWFEQSLIYSWESPFINQTFKCTCLNWCYKHWRLTVYIVHNPWCTTRNSKIVLIMHTYDAYLSVRVWPDIPLHYSESFMFECMVFLWITVPCPPSPTFSCLTAGGEQLVHWNGVHTYTPQAHKIQ